MDVCRTASTVQQRLGAIVAALALAALACSGCKKRPREDQKTPEKAIEAFFTALNKGRFPKDLERYVIDSMEVELWQFRCEQVGCKSATYDIVSRGEVTAYRAVFYIDYLVRGTWDQQVTKGTNSPVTVEREQDTWYVGRFGQLPAQEPAVTTDAASIDAASGEPPPPPSDAN